LGALLRKTGVPENHIPEQMIIGPGGRNITGQVLENERLRYSSALEHAIHEINSSDK